MNKTAFWVLCSLLLLILIVVFVVHLEDEADIVNIEAEPYYPPISVVVPEVQDHQGFIQTYAEVLPRWSTTIKAQVNGQIVAMADNAKVGMLVAENTTLMRLEDSLYRANQDQAELALAEANLKLLKEQKQTVQAERDYKRSDLKQKPSDLALNYPQLKVAEKLLSTAKSRLRAARQEYRYTRVKAPFSGIISKRYVSQGQMVSIGEELMDIIDNQQLEINLSLSSQQWQLLSPNWPQQTATLLDMADRPIGKARILRGGGFIERKSRRYSLFLEINPESHHAVLAGSFVQVVLPGRMIKDSLKVPESALTRDGYIWYVDTNNQLRRFTAKVYFHHAHNVIIESPNHLTKKTGGKTDKTIDDLHSALLPIRIASTPLASFVVGKTVEPRQSKD